MTDCCNNSNESTCSSDVISSLRRNNSRIRIVRLIRPQSSNRSLVLGRGTSLYGFALRGGREFGTGFFISNIEKGSQADLKGLKIGDQIIRVNGYHVDDAVHKELSQFISHQDRLTLKVRGVGMIPVKENTSDSLSWHIVPTNKSMQNVNGDHEYSNQELVVTLTVPPKTKLGLGICKGPTWKPGIYVQFAKESSVAQQAGLRPGDQILSCNGINFSEILFSVAVATMKSSSVLQLVIRAAVGLDLFPGESSGYNSSASSVTEEQIPAWIEKTSKRLSAKQNARLKLINPPRVPNTQKYNNHNNILNTNTTIIKLSDNGTVINNTLIPNIQEVVHQPINRQNCSIVLVQPEDFKPIITNRNINDIHTNDIKKIITVDVHSNNMGDIPSPPPNQLDMNKSSISTSNSESVNNSLGRSSLSSAIFDEVKRRAATRNISNEYIESSLNQLKDPTKILGNLAADKRNEKHSALMDEFKQAHKKMFKTESKVNQERKLSERIKNDGEHSNSVQQRLSNFQNNFASVKSKLDFAGGSETLKKLETSGHALQLAQTSTQSSPTDIQPETPVPDYDSTPDITLQKSSNIKGTMGRMASSEIAKANGAAAEMNSIESFKMTNPSSPIPKPPSQYFAPLSNGNSTMKKNNQKSVTVTVGEYGIFNDRRVPNKFDFINRSISKDTNEDASMKLQQELEKTLSRSNLKKKTEPEEIHIKNGIHESNNTNGIANMNGNEKHVNKKPAKLVLSKEQSLNVDKLSSIFSQHHIKSASNTSSPLIDESNTNRITINIPSNVNITNTDNPTRHLNFYFQD